MDSIKFWWLSVCLIVCLSFSIETLTAQPPIDPTTIDPTQVDPTQVDPSQIDINNVDFSKVEVQDIPSIDQLRLMGVPEADIQRIEQIRQDKLAAQNGDQENGDNGDNGDKDENTEDTDDEEEKKDDEPEEAIETVVSKIYGHQFFRNKNLEFYEKAADLKAPENYVLGPGDEISVSIWGFTNYDRTMLIDQNGSVNAKQIGRIYLKDMTFRQARSLIEGRFSQAYDMTNSQIEVTLTHSRPITVNIVGEAARPGSYRIPAVNTAFNALIGAGGLNDIGTVREIRIRRSGRTIKTLDVYDFLMDPSSNEDFFLQDNDFIYVPPIGKVIQIQGEVKRPMYYELKQKEELNELIAFAGGLTAKAYTKNIQIKRIVDSREMLLDLDYADLMKNKKDYALVDGDVVMIRPIPEGTTNTVIVNGAVGLPGIYEIRAGDKITDLLNKSQGVVYDAYLEEAVLFRIKPNLTREYIKVDLQQLLTDPNSAANLNLQPLDELQVFSKAAFTDFFQVHITGEVRAPGSYTYGNGLNLKQLISLAGGLKDNSFLDEAFIVRLNKDKTPTNITVELDTVNNLSKLSAISLERGDRVTIMAKTDFLDDFQIEVFGEARHPGKFPYSKGLTLRDALFMAGGLKQSAANNNIQISRIVEFDANINKIRPKRIEVQTFQVGDDLSMDEGAKNFVLLPHDQIFVRKVEGFRFQETVYVLGEVKYPGVYALKDDNVKLWDVINGEDYAKGLTNTAFLEGATLHRKWRGLGEVVLNLKKVKRNENSRMNYTLQHGDSIFIPRINELVSISGAIEYPKETSLVNAPYHGGKRAKYYVRRYGGGFAKKAHRKRTVVIEANGRVRRTSRLLFIKFYPVATKGSEIHVGYKQEKEKKEENKDKFDLEDRLDKLFTQLTAALTIIVLAQTLNNTK